MDKTPGISGCKIRLKVLGEVNQLLINFEYFTKLPIHPHPLTHRKMVCHAEYANVQAAELIHVNVMRTIDMQHYRHLHTACIKHEE
jgi:hypothetical protein